MKQRYLLTAFFFPLALSLAAQTPGGVRNPEVWTHDTASVRVAPGAGLTYVGVSRVLGGQEQTIWSIGNGKGTTRIQTTERAADLSHGTFINYVKDSLPEMRLYSYTTSSATGSGQTLHIGRTPNGRLPVRNLDGSTEEYVVYDRQLSDVERQRVESCLALKYGISLRSSYLNSRGAVIWNAYANKAYAHRIAGVISDSLSALHIGKGRSCEDGAFLTVSARTRLSDGQSLLWGDNNGKLSFATSKAYGKWLGRKWSTSATNMDGTGVDLVADSRQLRQIQPLSDGESYYLAVDPTGTGQFSVKTLLYYKAEKISGDSIVFQNVKPGRNDVFTLRTARDMFTTIEVRQPGEKNGSTGSLDVRVTGGVPPYRMKLCRERLSVFDRTSGDSLQTAEGLAEGKYLLSTTDRMGNVAENEFQVSTTGITEIPSDGTTGHDGSFFAHVKVIPVPTTDGYVDVQVELGEAAPLDMTLYTTGGATVSSRSDATDTYFATKVYLPSPGVCLLTLRSGDHEKTVKLIRK